MRWCGPDIGRSREFIAPLRRCLDSYIDMITDIALLLATLSIHHRRAGHHRRADQASALCWSRLPASVWQRWSAMAFIFGAILGSGLPPAPVYILVAIVIAPPFIQAGVNPWAVHFFAFFIGVFGELTPPTSITAAITSKIANASFYTTLWRSVQICVSLFTLMVGVFVHPELVIKPGLEQIGAAYLVAGGHTRHHVHACRRPIRRRARSTSPSRCALPPCRCSSCSRSMTSHRTSSRSALSPSSPTGFAERCGNRLSRSKSARTDPGRVGE